MRHSLSTLVQTLAALRFEQSPVPTLCVHGGDGECRPIIEVEAFDDAVVHTSGAVLVTGRPLIFATRRSTSQEGDQVEP